NIADDTAKVNLVAPEFKDDPHTYTSEADRIIERPNSGPMISPFADPIKAPSSSKPKRHESKEAKVNHMWELVRKYAIRPGVAGGLLGLVNVGLLASVGRTFYVRPHLRHDVSAISSTIALSIALISLEGFVAVRYLQTHRGKEAERKAKEEAVIFRNLHEQIMMPKILGGLLGMINAAVIGAVGYLSYVHWDRAWDRRTVSAISVGLLALWGGEG
ncbi:hypothetical protein CPB84DRAFT_1682540, partial [Gymnopilus junonius]